MVIIGLGTGGIKANVTPFCAEQYQKGSAFVKTLKSGERVVVDPELTVERMFMWYVPCSCHLCSTILIERSGSTGPLISALYHH